MTRFTFWIQQANGEGTTYVTTVSGTNAKDASEEAKRKCSEDWGPDYPPSDMRILGIAKGEVEILGWSDYGDNLLPEDFDQFSTVFAMLHGEPNMKRPESLNEKYRRIVASLVEKGGEVDIGETSNERRAYWAALCVDLFMGQTGSDPEYAIGDLVANLMHLARLTEQDPWQCVSRTSENFRMEEDEEKQDAEI